ncbi:acylneuraminate cytidylyltransferase family protein [Paenibacillus zanthoxyli]|uniref:acylneuraminate cytidylyltransferase family protein n=1 Tax=Paenibacillus zanthoxyli TaxID=369399 RepID=UPI0004BBEE89|nr:acylneuraminate cytidylyltransferase family protein [Paenibacillus zanthoxyli]
MTCADCLAVIPARKGSKGIRNKNMRLLAGRPLIDYSIHAALQSPYVSEVTVSTDSLEIAEFSRGAGASAPFIRPAELATDEARSIDVLRHAVTFYEQELGRHFKYILLLQPTSPLRSASDINTAFEIFLNQKADSLQSVSEAPAYPYLLRKMREGRLESYQEGQTVHLRRQEMEQLYALNGAIYILTRDLLINGNKMVGDCNAGYIMPRERSVDIDEEFDLKLAEFILGQNG